MKKINVEKTIENINKLYEKESFMTRTWEKKKGSSTIWFVFRLNKTYYEKRNINFPDDWYDDKSYEFGFTKNGNIIDGGISKKLILAIYGKHIVYEGEQNEK